MPEWKTKVSIVDLHDAFHDKKITVQELAAKVAKRLKLNRYAEELEDIIDGFISLSEDPEAEIDEYDYWLHELYDFADFDHRIWVNAVSKELK